MPRLCVRVGSCDGPNGSGRAAARANAKILQARVRTLRLIPIWSRDCEAMMPVAPQKPFSLYHKNCYMYMYACLLDVGSRPWGFGEEALTFFLSLWNSPTPACMPQSHLTRWPALVRFPFVCCLLKLDYGRLIAGAAAAVTSRLELGHNNTLL